jgi:hypothetical protein
MTLLLRTIGRFGPPGRRGAVLLACVAAVVLAACSSNSGDPSVASLPGGSAGSTATTPALSQSQSDQDMVDFARCLRRHGVAEPDPHHRPGHAGLSVEVPPPGPGTAAALRACNHFIGPIIEEKQAGARQELAAWLPSLVRYAQCMRAHNIAMLDPNGQGALDLGSVPGITNDFGRYSPEFRRADAACRHLLPAAVHDDGTGP